MSGSDGTVGNDPGVTALHTALDDLLTRDWTRNTDEEILDAWAAVESFRHRLAVLDHTLIAQVQTRHLDTERGATSTAVFARNLLGVSIGEAKARVKAAEAAGPRTALTGEALPPIYGEVAAAQAGGSISPAAAAVIVRTVDALPGAVQTVEVEAELVGYATTLDVDALGKAAQRLRGYYDQDGTLKEADHRERRREFTLRQRPDGSVHGSFEGTAELGEHLHTLFAALAAPAPRDRRRQRPPHRRAAAPRRAARRAQDAHPRRAAALRRRGHHHRHPHLRPARLDQPHRVRHHQPRRHHPHDEGPGMDRRAHPLRARRPRQSQNSRPRRTRTPAVHRSGQRLALIARDGGCSFPGCDRPPQMCQAHHVIDHTDGGPTAIENATLICGYHHRTFTQLGWTCHMTDGRPVWTPPTWMRRGTAA